MRTTGYEQATVADVLAEAGLSTGSFYRHFESKDQLLLEMYRRDAERAAERLAGRVRRAASPLEGLREWLDEFLSLVYDRRKYARVAVMGSPAARRASGHAEARRASTQLLVAPLVSVLEQGMADGSFPLARPSDDAMTIHAMAAGIIDQKLAGTCPMTQAEALAHLLRFCTSALGVPQRVADG